MASYSTGPFDSDLGQDLLEEYAELTVEERLADLSTVFQGRPSYPDGRRETVGESEALAAAALIAAALPGGEQLAEVDGVAEAAVPGVSADLVRLALLSLRRLIPPDGWWLRSWSRAEDREESRRTVDGVAGILESYLDR
jgi:hypothetical protein